MDRDRKLVRCRLALLISVLVAFALSACGSAVKDRAKTASQSSATGTAAQAPATTTGRGATPKTPVLPAGLQTVAKTYAAYRGDGDDDDVGVPRTKGTAADNDADFDNDLTGNGGNGYLDEDDATVAGFGHPASTVERQEVTALFQRYYAAALANDGARACRSIYSLFREAIPEDYGAGAGSAYARGKTCAEVMTKIFKHSHRLLTNSFHVTLVRVQGSRGYVLLGSKARPASYFNLQRERGHWTIIGLLAASLP